MLVAPLGTARAQANYRSTPTGGRSALMGNTGVALARDGAAPFLNPATIAGIDDANLAFAVNFYTFTATHFSGWRQPGAVDVAHFGNLQIDDRSTTANRFDGVPSTLCFFFNLAGGGGLEQTTEARAPVTDTTRRGRQKFSACLGTVQRQELALNALNFRTSGPSGVTQLAQSMSLSSAELHFGPSYAAYLTDDLAVGASIHAVVTTYRFASEGSAISSAAGAPGAAIASTLGAAGDGTSIDQTAILGLTYRLGRFTIGLSGQLPAIHVTGAYDANVHAGYSGAPGASDTLMTGTGSFSAAPAIRTALGVGVELPRLKVELDGTVFFPSRSALHTQLHVDSATVTAGVPTATAFDAVYDAASRPVVDVAIGAEYFVTPSLSVLGGASTDFGAYPPLAPTTTLADLVRTRTDRVMISAGIGSYGAFGDLLIGTELSYGWGQALATNAYVLPNAFAAIDTQTYGAMIVLAGSTNLKSLVRALDRVEEVLTKGKTTP